ncbi:hypothetical protein LUZ60_008510 [Juncus effusus]|nr:hypothetical protein LUZ60_008510 [Juncus effusus]
MPSLISTLSKIGEELSLFSFNSSEPKSPNLSDESTTTICLSEPDPSSMPMRVLKSVKLQIQTSKGFRMRKPKLIFTHELSQIETLIKDYTIPHNLLHLLIRVAIFSKRSIKPKTETNPPNPYIQPIITNPKMELNPSIDDLISSTQAGLENGHLPILSTEGTGGVYFMNGQTGCGFVSVFKPIDEEPLAINNPRGLSCGFQPSLNGEGLKKGTKVGQGAQREVAAYLLDHPLTGPRSSNDDISGSSADVSGFAGVMETVLVKCRYNTCADFKAGSLQRFVRGNLGSCEEMGPGVFSAKEVHKICVLDIRLGNADRHAGNILVRKEGEEYKLVPIDHGYCLPETFEDCTFEWLYWPQARVPFDEETIEYINSLDAEMDISILRSNGWDLSIECERTLRIGTMVLKKGVERNLTAFQIGSILCRENIDKESKIEEIIKEAENEMEGLEEKDEGVFMETIGRIMERVFDEI